MTFLWLFVAFILGILALMVLYWGFEPRSIVTEPEFDQWQWWVLLVIWLILAAFLAAASTSYFLIAVGGE